MLLLASCGAYWIGLSAQVPEQTNQEGSATAEVPLPAAGAWTPTGLDVAQGAFRGKSL